MPRPIIISPSLLSANFGRFAESAAELVESGADSLHFDIMDGHFVPNLTFGPELVVALRPVTECFFDVHLMVENTDQYIPALAKGGANMLTVHPEAEVHLDRLVHHVKDTGMKVGVALNPATPVSHIRWVLGIIDRVLVMTVNPGFGGQSFIAEMTSKIAELDQLRTTHNLDFEIAVDGGISAKTAPLVVKAGANVIIAGSAVFSHPDGLKSAITELRHSAEQAQI